MKLKVYVLMISRHFPATHPKKGQPTYFREKIMAGQGIQSALDVVAANFAGQGTLGWQPKRHTIRGNYDLWAKRAEQINAGKAVLSLREWTGSPYNFKRDGSVQREFLRLTKIGVQPLHLADCRLMVDRGKNKNIFAWVEKQISHNRLIANDGLSFEDFCAWFRIDTGKKKFEMKGCIIHFTEFRY